MNNISYLEKISKTGNLDTNLVLPQNKLDLRARFFMENKSVNPKIKHDQIAKGLGRSSSTLKRYRNDLQLILTYRISPNSHKRRQQIFSTNVDDNSNSEYDLKLISKE